MAYATELLYAVWIVLSLVLCSGMFVETPVVERMMKNRYWMKVVGLS